MSKFENQVNTRVSGNKAGEYGFNIKSQLLKLFIIFPAVSALTAWICTMFVK